MIKKTQETRQVYIHSTRSNATECVLPKVFVFVDIHGHSRKKNAFMYGVENRQQPFQECILPRLLYQNASIFSGGVEYARFSIVLYRRYFRRP